MAPFFSYRTLPRVNTVVGEAVAATAGEGESVVVAEAMFISPAGGDEAAKNRPRARDVTGKRPDR
jgi:hypothetical protein